MKESIIENLFPTPIYMNNIDRPFTKQELQFVNKQKKLCVKNQGNVNTNFMEALVKSQLDDSNFEDLFRVNISGQLGKDKELDYNLRGSKGNVGLNLSKTF